MRSRSLLQMPAVALAIAVALGSSSCGKSNPMAPVDPASGAGPGPTIVTPISAVITRIQVTKFPSRKQDGSDWDSSISPAARRPDLYVDIPSPSGGDEYVSNTVSDATTGTVYTFTSSVAGELPDVIAYGTSHRVYVMDEDFGGGDDTVGWITLNLPAAYGQDNARYLDHTFTDSARRISVRVYGIWNY